MFVWSIMSFKLFTHIANSCLMCILRSLPSMIKFQYHLDCLGNWNIWIIAMNNAFLWLYFYDEQWILWKWTSWFLNPTDACPCDLDCCACLLSLPSAIKLIRKYFKCLDMSICTFIWWIFSKMKMKCWFKKELEHENDSIFKKTFW